VKLFESVIIIKTNVLPPLDIVNLSRFWLSY